MKKIRLILIALFITLSIFVLSGCYYKDKSKTVIVNDIKVFDAYWTELKTEELYNNDVEWYFNTFNNGLKPINSPAPIVRYAGFTINTEDYALAKKKMKAKRVEYVPGVGIDLSKFENIRICKEDKRREIGVPEDSVLLISVGELNENCAKEMSKLRCKIRVNSR